MERLEELKRLWIQHKQAEHAANEARVEVELEIFQLVRDRLRETGTNHIDDQLTIVTKLDKKYDQEMLSQLRASGEVDVWPFRAEWKPDNKLMETMPADQLAKINQALTIKASKPTFKVESND
jgi:hypothetical protein